MNEDELREALKAAREALERANKALAAMSAGATDAGAEAATMLRQRRRRNAYFPPELFGEPGWDMLLVLFKARREQREPRQIHVFNEAGVPHTTGIRMLEQLEAAGLVECERIGPVARRRVVRLTEEAVARMTAYLEQQ